MTISLDVSENAVGACAVCGQDSTGSKYWTALPESVWSVIRPAVEHMFQDLDHIQNVLFFPSFCKPFCSAECSLVWHEQYGNYGQEEI